MAVDEAQRRRDRGNALVSPAPSVEEALHVVLSHVARLPAEEVPLLQAAGRALGTDVVAQADLWPFARAAMDGFAIRSQDVADASSSHPVVLQVIGEALAGFPVHREVTARTAVRIATGAPVPPGADAVIPIEQVSTKGDAVLIGGPVPAGRHIFPAGEDARRGEVILRAGTVPRAGSVALLASLGCRTVRVVRSASVAILTVGDELVDVGQEIRPGQVWESNSYALAAAVQECGGTPRRIGIARDAIDDIVSHLHAAADADAVVVCAGMSVGERDLVKEALCRAGVRLLFWRVPMKPGAPAAFGLWGSVPVFGLPGTPGAAMVAFEELVRPPLRKMMGYHQIHRAMLKARLSASVTLRPGRRRYLWAQAEAHNAGIFVRPLRGQGTATLRSISDANALLVVEPETAALRRGDQLRVQLLGELAAGVDPDSAIPVLGVVGAKGAGKTALIERLVPELRRRGYRVAAIKHDAHGFEIDREGTDTWRFAAAGADATAICGPGKVALIVRSEQEMSLPDVMNLISGVDVILVEGYSQEQLPKIEVQRRGVTSDKPAPSGPIICSVGGETDGVATLRSDRVQTLADLIEDNLLRG
jgi:molybdopterin molybdotransferase